MNLKKIALITIGTIALILGTIGAILPLLPTTPFVLLAAACYGRSSERLHAWLVNTKYFGEFIRHYKDKSGVRKITKIKAISFLWIALIISCFFIDIYWVWGILFIVGASVTTHISLIKTRTE